MLKTEAQQATICIPKQALNWETNKRCMLFSLFGSLNFEIVLGESCLEGFLCTKPPLMAKKYILQGQTIAGQVKFFKFLLF